MRKLLAGASVVLLGAGAASTASAQLALKGSDTLEDVAKTVITDCSDATKNPGTLLPAGSITYAGGGSGTGQGAMTANPPTQHIAPMSRPFNGTTCPVTPPATQGALDGRASQLLIGLDAVVVLHANWLHLGGDLSSDSGPFQCPDSILPGGSPLAINVPGCTTDGCDASGNYTFNSWKEVLAMIYGGQNNVTAQGALLANSGHCSVTTATTCSTAANCPAGETCVLTTGRPRNPARINCASPVRKFLADNWGALFENVDTTNCGYGPPPAGSTQPECLKLKHAFRRADSSGTSDTFVTLVGLPAIPVLSTQISGTGPNQCIEAFDGANATANPFCNAGPNPVLKGWSDYRDLDPIRRIADSTAAPRTGLEQVAEGGVAPVNPPAVKWNDNRVDPTTVLVELAEHGGSLSNWGPDLAGTSAAFVTAETADFAGRKGLGLVLPIEIPTNYGDEAVAYWAASAAGPGNPLNPPVLCDPGVFAGSLITAAKAGQFPICPLGGGAGNCQLPVHKNVDGSVNFNCISDLAVPAKSPLRDERYFNTVVVNSAGKLVKDAFCNPTIAAPIAAGGKNCSCAAQARPVSGWYRLHVNRATDLGGINHLGPATPSAPAGGPYPIASTCEKFSATDQIGCLVAANPCSIGFAGREGADKSVPGPVNNFAYKLGGDIAATGVHTPLPPTTNHVLDLLNSTITDFYPMSRKLFVNRWVDPALPEANATNFTNEETLFSCFQNDSITTPRISQFNFIPVPGGPTIDPACPNNR